MRRVVVAGIVGIVGVGLLAACTKPNPNRCCTDEADCKAKDIPVGSLCGEGLLCRGNQCIAEPCPSSAACDEAAPYCANDFCSEACTDDVQCPGFGQASAPYCVDGACVACRDSTACSGATPFCESGACRACRSHGECASDTCDVDAGTCVDESTLLYVTTTGSASSACTRAAPCTYLRAIAIVDASRPNLRLYPGAHDGGGDVISKALNVTMFGEAAASLSYLNIYTLAAFKVRDVDLPNGVQCTQPNVAMPRSKLDLRRSSVGGGLGMSRCDLILDHVDVSHPDYPGIELTGETTDGSDLTMTSSRILAGTVAVQVNEASRFHITNSVIRDQTVTGAFAHLASTALTSDVSFTTFYNTTWQCGDGPAWITGRDNVILNEKGGAPADTVTGTRCSHSYSLIRPQTATPSGSNNILGSDPRFVNGAAGDFHLVTGSPAIDTADPAATEAADYDGTSRPQGSARDMGAFEYKP